MALRRPRPATLLAIALIGALLAPLVPLVLWSVSRGWFFPALVPQTLSLDPWRFALSPASGLSAALGLSLAISGAATALAIVIGVPAGRALGMYRFRGKALVEMLMLAPVIVPGIAVVLGLQTVFVRLGLTGTVPGVILAHLIPTLPYVILVMAGVFSSFDADMEAQARSLGASPAQAFRHVTLPAILPGVIVGALFAFLVSWSQYLLTLVIGGGRVETLPLLLFNFAASGRNDLAGAIAILFILPGVAIVALTARHLTGRNAALGATVPL